LFDVSESCLSEFIRTTLAQIGHSAGPVNQTVRVDQFLSNHFESKSYLNKKMLE